MKNENLQVGTDAIKVKGRLKASKWLILRRLSQLTIIGLFILGPTSFGWILKGNISASLLLETIPLTDPFNYIQLLASRSVPELTALWGALIVAGFYWLVGGRAFCSWVCPINMVTDLAAWLRRKLNIKSKKPIHRNNRFWLLVALLVANLISGAVVWEMLNPVTIVFRSLVFGLSSGLLFAVMILLFDLLITERGWCGHLCPMGAFYSLLGKGSMLKIDASQREACNDCMDCFAVCPEPQVIRPALKGIKGHSSAINESQCTRCGRCVDICAPDVFRFSLSKAKVQERIDIAQVPTN